MWNQWSGGSSSIPSCSLGNSQAPIIGPIQPAVTTDLVPSQITAPAINSDGYSSSTGAPSYTPAQYAAMTPEQQYAVQQHWQQWQAYERQYAQWHAQYGEQYKREMAAIHGAPASIAPQYGIAATSTSVSNSFAYPPPSVANTYQVSLTPNQAPPPPPPEENTISAGIRALPQIYDQPPPPPPPPQNEENNSCPSHQLKSIPPVQVETGEASQLTRNQDSRYANPPPSIKKAASCWGESTAGEEQQNKLQHNPLNQQYNKNTNQRGKQIQNRNQLEDEQGPENRQRVGFRGRNRGRSGTFFENNRQQLNDDFDERTSRHQVWQQSESQSQRNNRRSFSNRLNSELCNKNIGRNFNSQAGLSSLNSKFSNSPDIQRQQQSQTEGIIVGDSQSLKNYSGSVDEKAFDEQFRLWEEQFENWKKENANHPDRTMYMQYEREFEKTRVRLLERREQMRRRKLMDLPQSMQQQVKDECCFQKSNQQRHNHQDFELKNMEVTRQEESSEIERKMDESGLVKTEKQSESALQINYSSLKLDISDTKVIKNKEITELFKTESGIPGLDLVDLKEEVKSENPIEREISSEIIELDNDGPSRPAKVAANNNASSLPLTVQSEVKPLLRDLSCRLHQPQKRKIPSLFDIVVEMPVLSPKDENLKKSPVRDCSTASRLSKADKVLANIDTPSRSISKDRDLLASPGQRPSSQLSSVSQLQQSISNDPDESNEQHVNHLLSNQQSHSLPPHASDLAKALQDPNVMQLLTVALAQVQHAGGIDQCGNPQQNQLFQQLQQLQPLIQMQQQERNSYNQSQDPQPWSNPKQNSSKNKFSTNSNHTRSSMSGNPFNRNNDQIFYNRGPGSGNESDSNNETQQRNPHNPFRRNVSMQATDENIGNKSSVRNFKGSSASSGINTDQGIFSGSGKAQQQRGQFGRFDNNRPQSNFGISLGFRNNQNNFDDRGGDNDYYRPAQVFDYQNRSRADALVPPAKVVDYGHKPSAAMQTNSFNRDNSEFVPVKTIDYGHASSSAQIDNQFQQKNIWNQDQKRNLLQTQVQGHPPFQGHNPNQEIFQEMLPSKSESVQNKEQNSQNKINQKENLNDRSKHTNETVGDKKMETIKKIDKESLKQLGDEEIPQYPNNKWILQNVESRRRPGPPTKRGRRNLCRLEINKTNVLYNSNLECEEIQENFEEISDNEDLNNDINIPSTISECSVQSRPLFPSVSDSIVNTSMVFPSMENNNTIPIDEILFKPGRLTRPKNIVIIIRGPPGSGKSYVAKLIKDKELDMGGPTPRLLSIDDYFMIENDYEEKCPKTGRKVPKKEILYEYEKEMEDTYMQYLIKSFKKTVMDHLFDFIIVDCCNQSLRTFNEFYNAARDGNFSPFVIDMICDLEICLSQNIHNRNEEDIRDIIKNYQECPGHYIKLDVSNLLENVVEMEDVSDLEDHFVADSEILDLDEEDETIDNDDGRFLKSKWDTDPTTQNLARLDGTSKPISKRGTATLEEYLQIDGWEPPTSGTNGKKRVRWADIEEKRAQDKMRAIGFVVGQTDWNRMMDPTSGSGALTKTKYIERLNKRR